MDTQIVVYSYDGILLSNKRNKLLINVISISWINLKSSMVNKGHNKKINNYLKMKEIIYMPSKHLANTNLKIYFYLFI